MSLFTRSLKTWFVIGSAVVGCALLIVYFGVFNVAADVPHSALVFDAMELVRDRSIAVRLKDIQVPTLVMVGEDEDHGSSHGITHLAFAKSLAASIPGAQLSVIPGHGHYYPLAAPATMHRIVRAFLAR